MAPNNYGEDDKLLQTWMEKYVPTPVIVDYVLRKLLLALVYVNLEVVRQASKVYGFNFRAEVSDRESWKWDLKQKLPVYRAQLEKVE